MPHEESDFAPFTKHSPLYYFLHVQPDHIFSDTPPRLKSRGFFCLSSVRDTMRNGAWLRLGAHRSGGGKAERAPPFRRVLSWAVPCLFVFPCLSQRDEWPTPSVSGVLERTNTRVFRRCSPGNVPQGRRLFLALVCLGCHTSSSRTSSGVVPAPQQRAAYSGTTQRVFVPPALRRRTRTRCSWKGTPDLFFLHRQKAVREGAKATDASLLGLKPRSLRRAKAYFCQEERYVCLLLPFDAVLLPS